MGKVIYSIEAQIDLKEIAEFIGKNSKHFAKKELLFIRIQNEKLLTNHYLGKVYELSASNQYREYVIKHYRIIYSIQNEDIKIHFVHHSARDITRRNINP